MKIKNPACEIEKLLNFAFRKNLITAIDMIPIRNSLLDLLGIRTPFEGDFQEELEITLGEILEDLLDFAVEQSVIEEDNITNRDLFDTRIMGLLTPAASVVTVSLRNISSKATRDCRRHRSSPGHLQMNFRK
ncbi:MAG: hypothetical protein EOM23_09465 [Candidatus Moranbacteria bacterium]|nr:hypothetical protein [Candidatus Moranbacteria bacterium]